MRGARRGAGGWGTLAVAASLVVAGWVAVPLQAASAAWDPSATALLGRTLVTWMSDGSAGAVEVDRSDNGDPWVRVADLPGDATSWVDDTVTPGATSTYRLVVTSTSGGAQTTGSSAPVVGASEELVLAAGDTPDLLSAPVGDGTPVPWSTMQAVGAPAVSPDGRSVAYEVRDPALGATSLWVRPTAPDGPAARLLVDDPTADELGPAWSPDGSRVCYTRDAHQGTPAIWCVSTSSDGAPAEPLPGGDGAAHPTFLPTVVRSWRSTRSTEGCCGSASTAPAAPSVDPKARTAPRSRPAGTWWRSAPSRPTGSPRCGPCPSAGGG